jgi:formate dehydrogenase beta subunit
VLGVFELQHVLARQTLVLAKRLCHCNSPNLKEGHIVDKTDTLHAKHFEKVVDCQYACPAHTPVPEYIRLIAEGRYTEAYMVNWYSNVFPGILGRVCDRPCEPACRRTRIDEPVAICRLKRVAADQRDEDISEWIPDVPAVKNGRKIALIGAGPASLTVARDLAPKGYILDIYDREKAAGGFIRTQIPAFRLPESVLNEEVNRVLDMDVNQIFSHEITSLKGLLEKDYDAIFVGTGAPLGRDLNVPGRYDCEDKIHIGIDWLANVSFGHFDSIAKNVIVLGGGNTAMDCCRTAKRLGGTDVKVVVRSSFDDMKASPWEKEDAIHEGVDLLCHHVPKRFIVEDGRLVAMAFELVNSVYNEAGRRTLESTGEPEVIIPCDEVLIAVGQDTAFPWIERDVGLEFNQWGQPTLNEETLQSSIPNVFFGGDAAFGPKNIITAVAHGHQAAKGIDAFLSKVSIEKQGFKLVSQKMGVHDWSYPNFIDETMRHAVPIVDLQTALRNLSMEVELGFDERTAAQEALRCLNCDVHTVFEDDKCIECNSCVDICPMDCINFLPNKDELPLRASLRVPAMNARQDLLVSGHLKTGMVMVKDEDVCLHCGLCAERCPTNAWDMQKFVSLETYF